MDGTFLRRSSPVVQQADAKTRHDSGDDGDRIRTPVLPPCQSGEVRTVEPPFDLLRARRLIVVPEVKLGQPHDDRVAPNPHAAPSPDTIVTSSVRHTIATQERAKRREAEIGAEHATEIAQLIRTIGNQRTAHAAEIERLRAEYAKDLARAVLERPMGLGKETAVRLQAQSPVRLFPRRDWLASMIGRVGF